MAIPPAASKAASEVVSTPSVLTVMTTNKIVIEIETKEEMNEASVGSTLRRVNIRFNPF